MTTHVFDNAHSLSDMMPELVITAAIMAVIAWDLLVKGRGKIEGIVAIVLGAAAYSGIVGGLVHQHTRYEYFGGLLRLHAVPAVARALFSFLPRLAAIPST